MIELGYEGSPKVNRQLPSRKYLQGPFEIHNTAGAPWTSARCNRLLRPISSKIILLRKETQCEHRRKEQHVGDSNDGQCWQGSPSTGATSKKGKHRGPPSVIATDGGTGWESSPRPRKKVKRTYSAKPRNLPSNEVVERNVEVQTFCQPSSAVIELPSNLSLETRPKDFCAHNGSSSQPPSPMHKDQYIPQALPKSLAASNWKLVDGICRGLLALLKATCTRETTTRIGCRSLFSSCLRQIPEYIAEEELIEKAENSDSDIDTSNLIYSQLEEFGSMPGAGWDPLRDLVRAHGIKFVTDAIEQGLLGLSVARHLFHLLLDMSALDAAESIVESLINLARPIDDSQSASAKQRPHDLHMTVNCLNTLACRFGRKSFLYHHTASMLNSGLISVDWISSKAMIGPWNEVIRSLTQEDGNARSAAFLLQSAVAMSYRRGNSASLQDVHELRLFVWTASHRPKLRSDRHDRTIDIRNTTQAGNSNTHRPRCREEEEDTGIISTIFNILTVVSAISRLQTLASLQTPDDSSRCISTILTDLALEARQTIDLTSLNGGSYQPALHAEIMRLPLLAAALAELPSAGPAGEIAQRRHFPLDTLACLQSNNEDLSRAGSFLCTVALYCGRARLEDPFNIVKDMVQEMIWLMRSIHVDESTQKICRDLALAAAFAFSEDTSRPSHLDWALQVELILTGKGPSTPKPAMVRTPARGSRRGKSGFRWEEGICEWIAKTPNLALGRPADNATDQNHVGDFTETPSKEVEGTLGRLLGISPCSTKKDTVKDERMYMKGEVKALHVLIENHTGSFGSDATFKESNRTKVPCRSKNPSQIKPLQYIYEDDDLDELSTPDPSQEAPAGLSTLREPPNVVIGAKRRRRSGWKEERKEVGASLRGLMGIRKLQSEEEGEKTDAKTEGAEVDELASLFTW